MTSPPPRRPDSRASSPIERIFVAWLLSTILLTGLLVLLTLLGVGQLRRQADALNRQQAQLDDLARRLAATDADPGAPRAATATPDSRPASPRDPARAQPTPASRPTPLAQVIDDAAVGAEFTALVGPPAARSARLFLRTTDPARGRELLARGEASPGLAAPALARLALLAATLGDDERSAYFQRTLAAANSLGVEEEIAARLAFETGDFAQASGHAILWMEAKDSPPAAAIILAICTAGQGDLDAAADAIAAIPPTTALDAPTLGAIGAMCVRVESWPALAALLDAASADARAAPAVQRLLAELLVHQRKTTEALAVIAALLDAAPRDAELQLLQVAALVGDRQYDAAGAALDRVAAAAPPGAAYWRGVIAQRGGAAAEARRWFKAALDADQRFAPAWTGLAQLEIADADAAGAGDLAAARNALAAAATDLAAATAANPRGASAFFLLAIVHAKASRAVEMREALRAAVHIDPALADEAKKVPAIVRLIAPEEIDGLAAVRE